MIDTVALRIDDYFIPSKYYDNFTPSAIGILKPPYYSFGKQKIIKCVLNPSSEDKKNGEYMPRVTLIKAVRSGYIDTFLRVEFSASKLLFNNNFDELTDDDSEKICSILSQKLRKMGVFVFSKTIENAEAKTIHYSKNIIIDNYLTASSVIAFLSKSNITTRKNASIKSYTNSGESVHFYTSKKGVVLYDKVAELNKAKITEKGRIEKDYYCQLSLFEKYPPRKPFEVLRIEARYIGKKSIEKVFADIDIKVSDLRFATLFSSEFSKAVLQHEFKNIKDSIMPISFNHQRLVDFANDINALNPNASFSTKIKAIGIKALILETGSRDIRNVMRATPSQWSRLTKTMRELKYSKVEDRNLTIIERQLDDFKPVKLLDYRGE